MMMSYGAAASSFAGFGVALPPVVRPPAEDSPIVATERFQQVRALAVALASALRSGSPTSTTLQAQVREFQVAASVSPTGKYGPATWQAETFFLPAGADVPPPWSGVQPGSWSPPAWTQTVTHETVVDRPRWFARWVLPFAGSIVLSGILVVAEGIRESRRAREGGT